MRGSRAEGGVQALHADAVGADPAVLYTSLQPALAACISELGAGSHERSFVVAHCLGAQGERNADLSDKQVTRMLQELAHFLNRKHGLG